MRRHNNEDDRQPQRCEAESGVVAVQSNAQPAMGCATACVGVNLVAMGLLAALFMAGSYSSAGQEFWYRYVSLGFLLAGAILPGLAAVWARRRPFVLMALVGWMTAVLLGWCGYVLNSGGGV